MFLSATLRRTVAGFFLLEMFGSLAAPSLSWASSGPGQPEFTSYESAGSPDMVNLSTGDMTYNLPVLQVPGPETTFSLPLTYRAGIRPEQEATWVGLGWSMNPGAIVRNVNGYPDDAAGERATNTYTDPGHRGWYGGVPGLLQLSWDSETGHAGSASLLGFASATWSGGKLQSGDIVGVGASRGEGATIDMLKFAGAAATVATAGAAAGASAAINGLSTGAKIALNAAGAVAMGIGAAAFSKTGPTGGGFNRPTINKEHTWFRTNYWVFVNDNSNEAMFGSLYFDKMSASTNPNFGDYGDANNYGPNVYDGLANYQAGISRKGYKFNYSRDFTSQGNFVTETAADMLQCVRPGNTDYESNCQEALGIAHDDFMVLGPGISGAIRPQRLDVGSLAYPRQMLEHHDKYNLVPWTSYKAQFRYENSPSNTYTHALPGTLTSSPAGVDGAHWDQSSLVITDPKLYAAGSARTEANRKGLTDKRLAQGKQIEWFSNKELAEANDASPATHPILEFSPNLAGTSTYQVLTGYQDVPGTHDDDPHTYEPIYETRSLTSNNLFRRQHPDNGIGAFRVTAEDGTTYHYSLPVYHFRQFTKTVEVTSSSSNQGVAIHRTGATGTDKPNYATAWLLTAITGPDFIDQGTIGVLDDQDQGSWVGFSYGKFAQQYKWRQPYVGNQTESSRDANTGITRGSSSFQEGCQETYYLNSIRTRTHTALFLKSLRQDARGHYTSTRRGGGTATTSNLGIDERTPSSSLRLDEIVVLSNPDLANLKQTTGFSEDTNSNAATQNATLGYSNDSFAGVFDQQDVAVNSAIRATLNQKALKRVVFNYSYRLCPGASNSFASAATPPDILGSYTSANRLGKLTLESVATYGPNSVKLIPDFRFDYGFNPAYGSDNYDAFGMYSSTAGNRLPSCEDALAARDGAAWSLTKITNPLGSVTNIVYERDQYASTSEYFNDIYTLTDQGATESTGVLAGNNYFDLRTVYRVQDKLHITGTAYEKYVVTEQTVDQSGNPSDYPTTDHIQCGTQFEDDYTIVAITANTIQLDRPLPGPDNSSSHCIPEDTQYYHYSGGNDGYGGTIANIRIPGNRNGGDLRVAAVNTQDENGHMYWVKYQYTNERTASGNSTGVLSKVPEEIRVEKFPFYQLTDYPATPVLYGQTTVLRGNFTTATDIDQREVYSFYTPTSAMVQVTNTTTNQQAKYPFLSVSDYIILRQQRNDVLIDLGLIGQAKSLQKYNRRGTLEFSTVFTYGKALPNADGIAQQGMFAEGALTSEFLNVENTSDYYSIYNINRTTKQYLPTTLTSTTTTTNNVAATTLNQTYDFYTGAVLATTLANSLGDVYRTSTVPAYTLYSGMGPKSVATGNAHMLTQTAATYTYKENRTAAPAVLTAGIQTWNNTWPSYRRYDAASDRYLPDASATAPVWRQHRTFVWQSPQLNPDGTYANFVAYNWQQNAQARNWLKAGEVTLYDHYSRPLESQDVNGQFATLKTGYDQSQVLTGAHNARYTEIAYSGAEDAQVVGTGVTHFGGEVRDGGRQSNQQQHTGQYSSLLTATNPLGFTYKALVGNANDLTTDRTYRASVWVHASDAQGNARLYMALNGNTVQEVNCLDASARRAGNWILLNLYVPLPANATGQQLTVGCRNAGSADVYVDDFRFHPLDAPLQTTVYNPSSRQPLAMLDNDNFYTRYEYDAAGKVVKVFREVLTSAGSSAPAERKIKESSYNYAQLKTPNWIETGTTCVTQSGQATGQQYRILRDVNTESPTYNQTQQQLTSQSCTP